MNIAVLQLNILVFFLTMSSWCMMTWNYLWGSVISRWAVVQGRCSLAKFSSHAVNGAVSVTRGHNGVRSTMTHLQSDVSIIVYIELLSTSNCLVCSN